MRDKKSRGAGRTRNWIFCVYPESAPKNWREIVDNTHIEWVESPLHDRDINPDGTTKKPHWHILALYESVKTFEQVKELTDSVNAPIPVKCQSVKGSIRYMVHKDNPEKFQYDWNDIVCHGGADLNTLCAPTATERLEIQKQILTYIRSAEITEFEDVVNYSMDNNLSDWLNVLLNYSTISIVAFVRSRRHKAEKAEKNREAGKFTVNKMTGEVIE
jgi:phenylpropionate dioxygenase-like ring-hydroxylating dioxygenase large terminal subunit